MLNRVTKYIDCPRPPILVGTLNKANASSEFIYTYIYTKTISIQYLLNISECNTLIVGNGKRSKNV